jgi:hypothetical protein
MSVEEAVKQLTSSDHLQPVLMKCGDATWVKLDHKAMPVKASCIADCMEFVLWSIMSSMSSMLLTLVYGLFEKMMGLKPSIGKSARLAEFCREIDL